MEKKYPYVPEAKDLTPQQNKKTDYISHLSTKLFPINNFRLQEAKNFSIHHINTHFFIKSHNTKSFFLFTQK